MVYPLLVFFGGLAVITLGAELVLRGSSRLASLMRIKPIVIGLTIVAMGTSMPEMAVGITAVREGMGSLAVGNIAGTNIFNIMFILGLSAAIRPLPLQMQSIKIDVPAMIITSLLLILIAADGILSRTDGWLLVVLGIVYTGLLLLQSHTAPPTVHAEIGKEILIKSKKKLQIGKQWLLFSTLLLAGILLTVIGARLMVTGAADIAHAFGVSDAIIGLTVVAIRTSAPELATTIIGTIRNNREVAVGNLIGSNIFNILVILGVTCVVAPQDLNVSRDMLNVDLPLAALVAIVCYPIFRSNRRVSRYEGIFFVVLYCVYFITLLILRT